MRLDETRGERRVNGRYPPILDSVKTADEVWARVREMRRRQRIASRIAPPELRAKPRLGHITFGPQHPDSLSARIGPVEFGPPAPEAIARGKPTMRAKPKSGKVSFGPYMPELLGKKMPKRRTEPTIADIQQAVCNATGVSAQDLVSAARSRAFVRPRQVAMWLSKQLTPRSLPEIGRRFGNRDHTTVLHAVRKIEALRKEDPDIADLISRAQRALGVA